MSRRASSRDLDLFLDESGTFMETSTDARERRQADQRGRRFPSQLAGLLVSRGALTRDTGKDALERVFRRLGTSAPESLHGLDLRAGAGFDRLVVSLVEEMDERGWQPVRLTNLEKVSFGDRVANYTNLVAELALRLFQQHQRVGYEKVGLGLTCAVVKLGDTADDLPILLEKDEYLGRLREAQARAAVHRGLAAESSGWTITSFRTGSARSWPELMLCDLISNASHNGFKKLGDEAREALSELMRPCDYTLRIRELLDRVDGHLDDLAFGPAIVLLAERATDADRGGPIAESIRRRVDRITGELTAVGSALRDPQLRLVYTHLEQTTMRLRNVKTGQRLASWISREIVPALRRGLSDIEGGRTLDWFEYGMSHLQLAACVLRGDPEGGSSHLEVMHDLRSSVASRFEHTEIALSGMVSEAMLCVERLEFDRALELVLSVGRFFEDLGRLFADAMAGTFPERVHADLRGLALSAGMRASMYKSLLYDESYDEARGLSDQAIEEFDAPSERREQYRFRCELEVRAGELETALEFLARGVSAEEATHESVAAGIQALADKSLARGVAILNWLSLGHAELQQGGEDRAREFLTAWQRSKLDNDPWCRIGQGPFPRQGILRRVAELQAIAGDRDRALASMALLQQAAGPVHESTQILGWLAATGAMRVAAHLHGAHPKHANKLLDHSDRERPGALQRLEPIVANASPALRHWAERWVETCRRVIDDPGADARGLLLGITRKFPF